MNKWMKILKIVLTAAASILAASEIPDAAGGLMEGNENLLAGAIAGGAYLVGKFQKKASEEIKDAKFQDRVEKRSK